MRRDYIGGDYLTFTLAMSAERGCLMKKVRYVIGAAGSVPALGMMVPVAAVAAPAAAQHAAKSVNTGLLRSGHPSPLTNCGSKSHAHDTSGLLSANDGFSKGCLHSQTAILNKAKTGLAERVRFYSGAGQLESTRYRKGTIESNSGVGITFFSSSPNSFARKVCIAITTNTAAHTLEYGPVCLKA